MSDQLNSLQASRANSKCVFNIFIRHAAFSLQRKCEEQVQCRHMTFGNVTTEQSFEVKIQNTQMASKIIRLKKRRKVQVFFSIFFPQLTQNPCRNASRLNICRWNVDSYGLCLFKVCQQSTGRRSILQCSEDELRTPSSFPPVRNMML